jgi:phospholipid/cholesterol/gamma-HCH transport system substrate-binding protein
MLSREQRIGLFFLIGLVLLFVAIEVTLGLGLFRARYPLYATFRDVQGLDVGADVRLAGLRAGRVESMRIEGDRVVVGMAIDERHTVRTDSVARLDFRALTGDRFVAISLGSPEAPAVAPGGTIPGEVPAGFGEVFDQLAAVAENVRDLTDTLNLHAGRLLTNLADLVEENRETLGATVDHLASITGKLDAGTGTLGLLLNDPTLYDRAAEAMGEVRQSVHEIGRVAADLAGGRGTLGKLVTRDDGLYEQVRETMDALDATARNVQEITDDLRAGRGTIGRALVDEALYAEAQDTLRTVNRATQAVEDQAPISLLGTIITSLF